jgi:hypothetical protein
MTIISSSARAAAGTGARTASRCAPGTIYAAFLAGRVRAQGDSPDALTWEIGMRTRQRLLMRLIGRRYAVGAI